MDNQDTIWPFVERKADPMIMLSDAVWEVPELNYGEFTSCALHKDALAAQGFRITTDIAGLPTAVMGEAGEGGPVIAFLGEYDALPGLSQEAGKTSHTPVPGDGNGHGCGHNLLGSAALLAATAVKDWLAETGTPGRVRYYGCPAEEGGAGKGFMVRAGVFKDVDIAITWHPAHFAGVFPAASLANQRIDFTFTGRAAHAAAAPHLGRSALDAAELMNIGVNYMREHMLSSSRVHYAYQDAGGVAPNVVQARTVIRYTVRATELDEMLKLGVRVRTIAEGAALMTETSVTSQVISGMANLLGNTTLEMAMQANFERLGPPQFDEADRAFARQIQATLTPDEIASPYKAANLPVDMDKPLCDAILAYRADNFRSMMGSTDVGDVSWVVPTVQAFGATCAIGTPFHSWQLTAQGKAPLAHKGMVHVAKVMAGTAIDVLKDETLLARAKREHADKIAACPYISPIPDDVDPPLVPMPGRAA
ncbi:aminobenzoyl-glutamate utilization protein [Ameyamaea chiangmaiensis NBRC 103196]|uniref:Amidohydrolase n=1 Tax=Ameyamaea chiangmaiensis TaxID=442969 RepID=A0A850P6M0_9PROT|nr:amidohydrolase [Ameyamaea chiangmaiensis]MBS4075694.1 amidohydrolase [Ameyamaea chiangmaiensis]NVN40267.1 amidohydrolase [Ameyamaea chiangmaiensis]GBQ70485.1 aminobenzoyl-glutamate utilization protein [Ameyamaea chiangmaiensis NBRC 103196]